MAKDTNLHSENLRDWKKGQPLTAKHFQEPIKFLKQNFNGVRPARQVSGRAGANFAVRKLLVVRVEIDFLICKKEENDAVTDEIKVALPPEMRKQEYDFEENGGKTRTLPNGRENKYEYLNTQKRKAIDVTDETSTEIQVVTPAYVENDIIFAMQGIQGGTGLTELIQGVEVPVKLQDQNVSGRAWAKAADQTDET